MIYLLFVSILWAFSFGLIKTNLTNLDPFLVSFLRLFISFIIFLPFLRLKNISNTLKVKLIGTGSIQFGFMYLAYIYSYQYLASYEIALFTILTPLFVTLINDLLNRKFTLVFLLTSLLAIIGAAIIRYENILSQDFLTGFILVQISNICFAAGQIFYTRIKKEIPNSNSTNLFALLYLGAAFISGIPAVFTTDFSSLVFTSEQILAIIYLGAIASGVGFFLWNVGATKVNEGALAVFNNLKIPLAVAVSLTIFNESGNVIRLLTGGAIIFASLLINEKYRST